MSRKLYDQLKSEKSLYDHHHEANKSEEHGALKSHRNRHKHGGDYGNTSEEDEMVKYMSNLPGYLERGKKNREKALNVGVLDWSRLEQWQYRSSRCSTSSNASSSVSTDSLSGHSSKGNNCGPSGQRVNHPSLQSHFATSPMQGHCSEAVKASRESVGNIQNFRGSPSNIDTQSNYLRSNDYVSKNHPNDRLKGCNRSYLDQYIETESGGFPNGRMYVAASCGRTMGIHTQEGELEKRVETLRRPSTNTVAQGTLRKSEPVVLRLSRGGPQNNHCRVPDTRTNLVRKSENSSRISFSEKPKELYRKDRDYDISQHSCSLPDELSCNRSQCQGSGSSSTDLESIIVPPSTFSAPLSVKTTRTSPSRFRKTEEKKPNVGTASSANAHLQGPDPKVISEKPRSSSPFRRLSISIGGYTSRGSAGKESGHMQHPSSIAAPKSDVRGYADTSNTLVSDKPGDAARRRSSPFRRLLDPLLKPKSAKICHSMESSCQKDSVLINKNHNPANGKFSDQKPDKELDRDLRVGCSSVNTVDPSKDKKHALSMTQALLSISVRNGMPLFTFAVDNTGTNILAATVKNLSSATGKDECNCIYTFFNFREAKKNNGSWMKNQAGRSKGPDYIPHVLAQMKVSDSHYYDLTGQNCADSSTVKEFVLLSVTLGQGDDAQEDYQPNDELAAVVVKIPNSISFIDDPHRSGYLSEKSQDRLRATVLLPGGVHSLPSKGGPSSLIERWKTGGSCDCGGWDLGCKLKILSNENQACRKARSSKAYFADQLELFFQGNEQEDRPGISVTPFKHGVYSIAFDSSLSLVQAFAVCMALMDTTKMPYELSGSRSSIEEKNRREATLLVGSEELKAFGKLEDIPASYVSYPPVSPVGRV